MLNPILNKLLSSHFAKSKLLHADPVRREELYVLRFEMDAAYYLDRNPDVREQGVDPALHYYIDGWREMRDPRPDFSTRSYLEERPELLELQINPFLHFIRKQQGSEAKREEVNENKELSNLVEGSEAELDGPSIELDFDVFDEDDDDALEINENPNIKLSPDGTTYVKNNAFSAEGNTKSFVDQELDRIWNDLVGESVVLRRPDFRFDGDFYTNLYGDVSAAKALDHYMRYGAREGRSPNKYTMVSRHCKDVKDLVRESITEPRLKKALEAGWPNSHELAYELMALGHPYDQAISNFSERYYLDCYSDIADAGVDPLQHYFIHGAKEGRSDLHKLRRKLVEGKVAFDPDKPTCLICSHEFSRTGAPIVALEMCRDAIETHNVIVAALRPGELEGSFLEHTTLQFVSDQPFEEIHYLEHPAIEAIDFAILNSVESFPFCKYLVARGIPFGSYIHEYTNYTFPRYKSKLMCLFSDVMIFSSGQVRRNWRYEFEEVEFNTECDSLIVAQEELPQPNLAESAYEASRITLSNILNLNCSNRRIIYGAGHVQMRKGTDLFVLAAQLARQADPNAIFVWIGDGLNNEDVQFGVWLACHLENMRLNDVKGNIFFIPAGPYYHDVCKAADVLFLSSRLDPLPNVVFDAVRYGTKVVAFEEASGFSDCIYKKSDFIHGVEYGNIEKANSKLLSLALKKNRLPFYSDPSGSTKKKKRASPFHAIRGKIFANLSSPAPREAHRFEYDVPILFKNDDDHKQLRIREREKLAKLERAMIWRSREQVEERLRTSGNWMHKRSRIARFSTATTNVLGEKKGPKIGIHVHAYYVDEIENDLDNYIAFRCASRIVATTDSMSKASEIKKMFSTRGLDVETRVMPNRGRDILPFLELVSSETETPEDMIWGHFHMKKSIGSAQGGGIWRKFLLDSLLGDAQRISSALLEIKKEKTGLVTTLDPYIVGWESNRRLLPEISNLVGRQLPDHPLLFPVGNMFWAKASVVRGAMDVFGKDYPWPNEPIPNDGTVCHLIERLWPAFACLQDKDSVFIDAPHLPRA